MTRTREVFHGTEKARVAFVFWEGYLGVAPSIINAVQLLANNGYDVDVITRHIAENFAAAPDFPKGVRVLTMEPAGKTLLRGLRRALRKVLSPIRDRNLYELLELIRFFLFSLRCTRNFRYACFIGIDMLGLITATMTGMIRRTPILYWSLEIKFLSEFKRPTDKLLKHLERFCNHRAVSTIIQDTPRSIALMSENRIDPSKILIVPNSPLGPAPQGRTDFLRRKFGLLPGQRIILHIGMIDDASLSLEIAREASEWPDNWVLVMHERAKRDLSHPYLRQVREAGKGKVFQSLDPVPYDQLDTVVTSGDVGIVLYRKELGPNFAYAGSSGKLGHYLRCGLPVVCLDLPGLSEIVRKYQCGISVRDVEQVRQGVESVLADYEFFSANAVRCYELEYEFGIHFRQVLRQVQKLVTEGKTNAVAGKNPTTRPSS